LLAGCSPAEPASSSDLYRKIKNKSKKNGSTLAFQHRKAAVKFMFTEDDIIFSYTTKMAVEDGILIPISGII